MENSQENQPRPWTWEENKKFEVALVEFGEETADRWRTIAGILPGRSPEEVEEHFNKLVYDVSAIEAGLVLLPNYSDDDVASGDVAAVEERRMVGSKKGNGWTEEEHRWLFKYGKGNWRSISRNCVKTRSSTQVASHAQKYYNRKNQKGNTRRSSIHDITLDSDDEDSLSGPEKITNINTEHVSSGLIIGDIHISKYASSSSHQIPNQVGFVENNNGPSENNFVPDLYHQGDSNANDMMMICHPTLSQNQFSMGINNTNDLSNSQIFNLQNGDVFMGDDGVNYPYISVANGDGPSNFSPAQHYNMISCSGSLRQVNDGHSNLKAIDLQYGDVYMGNGNVNYVNNRSVYPRVSLPNHQANGNCAGSSDSLSPHHSGSMRHVVASHHPGSSNYVSYSPPAHHYNMDINQGSIKHIPNSQTIDLQNGCVFMCNSDTCYVHNCSAHPCFSMPNGQVNNNGAGVSDFVPDQHPPNKQVIDRFENSTAPSRM